MSQKLITMPGGLKLAEEDIQYFNEKPSPGFSPDKNKAVIALTIKKYKAYLAQKQRAYDRGLEERTEALTTYFKHLNQGKNTPVEQYFGRKNLAELRGRKIMSTIFKAANGQKGLILGNSDTIIH